MSLLLTGDQSWSMCPEKPSEHSKDLSLFQLVLFRYHSLWWTLFPLTSLALNLRPAAGSICMWACSQHQHHRVFCDWGLPSPDVLSIHPSIDPLFHLFIQHPYHRKPVPAAPPNGWSSLVVKAFKLFLPPHACEPQMVSRLSRVLCGATYAQCSEFFSPADLSSLSD